MTDVGNRDGPASADLPSICVVSHPLGEAGKTATGQLMDILAAVTSVSLMTAAVPASSSIRDDHEVIQLSSSNTGDSIPVAAGRFLANQIRMCYTLARRDEPVVLFFGATSYLLPIVVARLLGKTVILQPRGDVPLTLRLTWEQRVPDVVARGLAGVVGALERVGYHLSDAIITYTPAMADELGLDRYSEKLYPDGARHVDTETFSPTIPFEERDRVVGFLGRLDEEKGIRTLAEVASDLPDDVTFRFIGDGDLREWLESELAAEIRSGQVQVAGWVDHEEVPTELSRLRCLVLPSEPTEGLPTVILEALACGTPVYATPVSGVPDVVRDAETGFLMRDQSATAIRNDIIEILDRPDLETVSENGRALIAEDHTFEAAVDRYTRMLLQISATD